MGRVPQGKLQNETSSQLVRGGSLIVLQFQPVCGDGNEPTGQHGKIQMRHDEAIDQSQNENKMGKRGQRQGPVEDEMGEGGDGESKIMTSLLLSMIERQDFTYL